jgi:hypothetical protein
VLPVLAKVDFKGNAATYALMLVAMGVGSVAGALTAARARGPRLRVVVGAALSMGTVMLVAAAARSLALEVAVLVALGFFSLLYLSTTNSTCQLASAPEMRGRVMGIYSVIFTGSTPVGALLIGLVDQELGARWGLVVGAVPTLVAAAVLGAVLLRRQGTAPMLSRSRLARRRRASVGDAGPQPVGRGRASADGADAGPAWARRASAGGGAPASAGGGAPASAGEPGLSRWGRRRAGVGAPVLSQWPGLSRPSGPFGGGGPS